MYYFTVVNKNVVYDLNVSPGRNTVVGYCSRLGESGKCCVSRQKAVRAKYFLSCLPAYSPLSQLAVYSCMPGSVVNTVIAIPVRGDTQ